MEPCKEAKYTDWGCNRGVCDPNHNGRPIAAGMFLICQKFQLTVYILLGPKHLLQPTFPKGPKFLCSRLYGFYTRNDGYHFGK